MVQRRLKEWQPVNETSRADIVFCIDLSTSMTPCIEGVKANLRNFVKILENDPTLSIDWRLGFLGHKYPKKEIIFYIMDFTKDISHFEQVLDGLETYGDEINLPAIDWCLDFPWRVDAHKFVISFTDEPVERGWNPALSLEKIDELMGKIQKVGASLIIVSFEKFKHYLKLCTVDKGVFVPVHGGKKGFKDVSFDKMMTKIAQKVSRGSRGIVAQQGGVKKDIFGIKEIARVVHL